jgi:lipoate-protein ligase A
LVVVGRSSKVEIEVNLAEARRRGVPVLRRPSGGAAIVTGAGCLMYAVILSYERHPHLHMLDEAHRYVLSRIAAALGPLGIAADVRGTSDLVVGDRKFSGNSVRCKRTHFLYHGTILCQPFPLETIPALLGTAPRQPDYRARRSHEEFVMSLPATVDQARAALIAGWPIDGLRIQWPELAVAELAANRYSRDDWNLHGR